MDISCNASYRVAEKFVKYPHLFGVTFGKVVVDRNNMHPFPCHGIEYYSKGGYKGLPFTGLHLCNVPVMQYHTSYHLHIIVPHAQSTSAYFTCNGKGVVKYVIQTLVTAVDRSFEEIECLFELIIAHRFIFTFEGIDIFYFFEVVFDDPVILCAKNFE